MAPTMRCRMSRPTSRADPGFTRVSAMGCAPLSQLAARLHAWRARPFVTADRHRHRSPIVNNGFSEAIGFLQDHGDPLPRHGRISVSISDEILAFEHHLPLTITGRGRQRRGKMSQGQGALPEAVTPNQKNVQGPRIDAQ